MSSPGAQLETLVQQILEDVATQDRLLAFTDVAAFREEIVRLGHARGLDVDPAAVDRALREGRSAWILRWVT